MLIPPLDSLTAPLKPPQPLLLPSLEASAEGQKGAVLERASVDPRHTSAAVPTTEREKEDETGVKEKKEGEVTVLSVGR